MASFAPDSSTWPVHPLGTKARVLLCSVFGPYAVDDEYGSRKISPMELYHNQVTRVQGPWSMRMFHRSWGLMLIQTNILAPCTLLDFPTLDRFIEEVRDRDYDIVGISSISPNTGKVTKRCQLIREHLPEATIVVGGQIASVPGLDRIIDADHIFRGEGVQWFRHLLGEDERQPINHPRIVMGINARTMGVPVPDKPDDSKATLIPGVGCPIGCNFCATSAMFGGKGKVVNFYETGDEMFDVMCGLEHDMKVRSFFVMDENFLLLRKRAMRLLQLMEQHDKVWSFYMFGSANVIMSYTMDQLVRFGLSGLWLGLESQTSRYPKLKGIDTLELVRELQSHGIQVLGSTIIGLEHHTPDNIDDVIDHAVLHDADFHQFMIYTAIFGTPLYSELEAAGKLLHPGAENVADTHGQFAFNYRHPHIPPGKETEYLLRAFERDFYVNGPSVVRTARTLLQGWRRHRDHSDPRVRRRWEWEIRHLPTHHAGALWAARKWFADNPALQERIDHVLRDVMAEFGDQAQRAAPLVGRYVYERLEAEDRRLRDGRSYEPPTFYDQTNQPA